MLFLLWLALGAHAQVCTSQDTLIAQSYAACLTLPKCMDAFYMTPKHRIIEQVAFNDLIVHVIDAAAPLTYVEICANNQSFQVWCYGTLQLQHFCRDNEIWDVKYKSCVCRHDKICIDEAAGTINYGDVIIAVLIAIAIVAVLMVCSQLLKETKEIGRAYKSMAHPATAAVIPPIKSNRALFFNIKSTQ